MSNDQNKSQPNDDAPITMGELSTEEMTVIAAALMTLCESGLSIFTKGGPHVIRHVDNYRVLAKFAGMLLRTLSLEVAPSLADQARLAGEIESFFTDVSVRQSHADAARSAGKAAKAARNSLN
jgi:hypothetical protein